MRILFCNANYPGGFGRMPSDLAADPANEVMFLSFHPRKENAPSGVIHARLNLNRDREHIPRNRDAFVSEWEKMFSLGKQAMQTLLHIRDSGFVPDMIYTSLFDGPALFLRHIFPHAFIIFYFNGFRSRGGDVGRFQAVMDFQRAMAAQSNLYFVRSEMQKSSFPPVLHPLVHVWPPHVDTEFFHPAPRNLSLFFPDEPPDSDRELITGHMKGSGHSQKELMRVMLDLLECRPHCLAAFAFENEAVRRQWQQALHALPEHLHRRLFLAGGLDGATYHHLLCSSTVYIFPEYASPPLQGMLEAMSCETLLMTPVSDGADEFLRHGETMVAFPKQGKERQLEAICRVIDHPEACDAIRKRGRKRIAARCSDRVVFFEHLNFVMNAYKNFKKHGGWIAQP